MSLFWKGLLRQQRCLPRRAVLSLEELERRYAPASTISLAGNGVIQPMSDGTVDLVFNVVRTGDTSAQVTVGYTTGTAQTRTAVEPSTGTVTFAPGATQAQIILPFSGSGLANTPSRTFDLELTGIVNVVGGGPSFTNAVNLTTGNSAISVAVADINGDGRPDLLVANAGSNTVSVLLNETPTGSTTPVFAPAVNFATGDDPTSVAVADFNGDGKPDIVVANWNDNTVSVLMNETPTGSLTPSFAPAVNFSAGNHPYYLAVADINGDGKPDIAVTNTSDNGVSVLMNETPTGSMTPAFTPAGEFATGSQPYSLAVADINGDGQPDLIVGNAGSNSVSVLMNQTPTGSATASFAPAVDFATGTDPFSVAVGDFTGDGRPDLAVANLRSNTVSVLVNRTETGSSRPDFAPAVDFATGTNPFSVAVGDFAGDGRLDLAVANASSNTVSLLLNRTPAGATTPTFAPAVDFATGDHPFFVAAADFNGTGNLDLAFANFGSGSVSLLLDGPGQPSIGSNTAEVVFSSETDIAPVPVSDVNTPSTPTLPFAPYSGNTVTGLLHQTTGSVAFNGQQSTRTDSASPGANSNTDVWLGLASSLRSGSWLDQLNTSRATGTSSASDAVWMTPIGNGDFERG
jgi:hypothetical protein